MQLNVRRAVIVCALGFFIDIFDIQLFSVLRIPSLTELGVPLDKLSVIGGNILNAQMFGMVLGAFLWGWLGDRFGRIKPLYGSILIYSLGTLACSFVQGPIMYGISRFVTGFGLAGETGIAVTFIAELMPPGKRNIGISIIGGLGTFGPLLAIALSWFLDWRVTYFTAGLLGLLILVSRIKLVEPALFEKNREKDLSKGSLRLLLQPHQIMVFLNCLAIGLPTIYAANLLNFFSLEIGQTIVRAGETFNPKLSMLLFFLGLGSGNLSIGIYSQYLKRQRKALFSFLIMGAIVSLAYLAIGPVIKLPSILMYAITFVIGFVAGNISLVALITAEQFGTNIRATATALMTNAIRAGVIPMILVFQYLKGIMSVSSAAAVVGGIIVIIALLGLCRLKETDSLDLDYIEKVK